MSTLVAQWWFAWVMVALVSAVIEVALPMFAFVFVAAGALVAAAASLAFSPVVQIITFSGATLGALVFVRPWLKVAAALPSRTEALVGRAGVALTALTPEGRVRLGDEDWAARASIAIEIDRNIKVTGADGIVLLVEEI